LNDNASIIDKALGSFTTVSATNGTVNLTLSQCQNMCIKTGVDVFVSDVTFVIPSGVAGQWVFINQSAASAFSLIVKNAASGTVLTIPSGQTRAVYSDGVTVTQLTTSISTQAQAEAKTDNTTAMSPLRTAQQITSSLSSQVQAQAGTDNATLMTPLRTNEAIAALSINPYKNYQLFTTSGTWVKPASVSKVFAIVVGGGGGGGAGQSGTNGGDGGYGGRGANLITVTGNVTVTVGAGGAGSNASSNGATGGTSIFSTISATGGLGGIFANGGAASSPGTSSGGAIRAYNSISQTMLYLAVPDATLLTIFGTDLSIVRPNASSATAGITYLPGRGYMWGAGGNGETGGPSDNTSGGCGGAVLVLW
jgi:hypothetical protein